MSKKELHPQDYREVVFMDESAGFSFLTRSTAASKETIKWEDGKEYPLVKDYDVPPREANPWRGHKRPWC